MCKIDAASRTEDDPVFYETCFLGTHAAKLVPMRERAVGAHDAVARNAFGVGVALQYPPHMSRVGDATAVREGGIGDDTTLWHPA